LELPPFFRNFCNNFIQKSAQWLTLKKNYTIFNGINTYTYDYTLCGRTAMFRLTFKL